MRTKKRTRKVWVKNQLKESLLPYRFIRTFVQYIEYNVPLYIGKSKKTK